MVKSVSRFAKFLVIRHDDDGNDIAEYINVDKIISIEFAETIVSILCVGDVEYQFRVTTSDITQIKSQLHYIYHENYGKAKI